MIQHTSNILTGGILAFFLMLTSSLAAADDSKPRYVQGNGKDSGDCRNSFRPCRTLQYTLSVAGKGDSILVGDGEFSINNAEEVFSLTTASHRIRAGMDRLSGYSLQKPNEVLARIEGVPAEHRETFEAMGFRVLVDAKGVESPRMKAMLQQMKATQKSHGQTDCSANMADDYPCENINLHSHLFSSGMLSGATVASDIWGFSDLNTMREYVIIALSNGAAVVDVTNPESPLVIGTHTGLNSTWRDVKIFQTWDADASRWRAYAYISTEANMGMAILDLSDLPNSVRSVEYVSDFTTAHNVYLLNTDYSYGVAANGVEPLLVVAGANLAGGRYRLYDLNTPSNPGLVDISTTGYIHDAASVMIRDLRKDSQCSNADAEEACHVLADFNESSVDIWDVTDSNNPDLLATRSYPGAAYVHSGWWSEDTQFLFVHDELDETNNFLNTTVRVFDMRDLTSPLLVGSWVGPTRAIDHNGFVRGNRYYMSNYTEGLTVLDISTPESPERVGRFDTVPASSSAAFAGAWGVYPFLPSGTIAISDIQSGLYLLEDQTLVSNAGSIAFTSANYSGVEGESIDISVIREGDSGEVSIDLELVFFTATSQDLILDTNNLSWANGESGEKTVSLNINVDGDEEGIEHLALRLSNPGGGASLAQTNIAQVYISESGSTSRIIPLQSNIEIPQSNETIFVTLKRGANVEGEISVDWQLNVDEIAEDNGSISWADGDALPKTLELTNNYNADQNLTLNLSNAAGAILTEETIDIELDGGNGGSGGSSSGGSAGGGQPTVNGSSGGGSIHWVILLMLMSLAFVKILRPGPKAW